MASRLDIGLANGLDATARERKEALRKVQTIVDAAVAPRIDLRAQDEGSFVRVTFPDDIAEEQTLAAFRAAVNLSGLPESPLAAGSALLEDVTSGDDLRSPLQTVYSV
jgi:hypothetical protein